MGRVSEPGVGPGADYAIPVIRGALTQEHEGLNRTRMHASDSKGHNPPVPSLGEEFVDFLEETIPVDEKKGSSAR